MDQVTIGSFRCFRDAQTARLTPLTLLVGENSTGKTSFMAMIRALWDVAFHNRVPDFKEDPYDLGSFDEIAHHRGARGGRADEFHAGFTVNSTPRRKKGAPPDDRAGSCRFSVTFRRRGTAPVPVVRRLADEHASIEVRQDPEGAWLTFNTRGGSWKLRIPNFFSSRLDVDEPQTLDPFFFAANEFFRAPLDSEDPSAP